ncbi:MAG TPA: 6-hydroxymethylpterin diphosphokinase MptE-like protein [Bryobacteraceae bacterium]|jgi:hypothetical protein|nr:6-hydroxymethylpterin diphosphokinase MptE-like protein [Bryobacteraceae bacterium]
MFDKMQKQLPPVLPIAPLLQRKATINPYRIGCHEILSRLRWDLRLESWRSRKKLRALKDSHAGEKAIILCNGPSLNRADFDLLKRTYCFGLNKIHLLFQRTSFRPSCIVAVNAFVIQQAASFYNETEIPLFLSSVGLGIVRRAINRVFIHPTGLHRRFARDCSMSFYEGHTVTYAAMQLAYHMGFTDVALIGCDHYFETRGPGGLVVQGGDKDPNHFDPNYFANVPWQLPDLLESEVSYRMAYNIFTVGGRRLVNATDGGKLEILPRMSLGSFLCAR